MEETAVDLEAKAPQGAGHEGSRGWHPGLIEPMQSTGKILRDSESDHLNLASIAQLPDGKRPCSVQDVRRVDQAPLPLIRFALRRALQ